MTMDRAGWPFVLGAVVPGGLAWSLQWTWVAAGFGLLALFFAFFFRDPRRTVPADPSAILSPADGRVLVAGAAQPGVAPPGAWTQVSIFLSPLDVHINRVPASGRVVRVVRTPGRYLAAYRAESAAQNSRTEVWIDHAGASIVCRQVVGVLARRLVCRLREGDQVAAGQKYGLMKFGSRIDLFLPPSVTLVVEAGDVVRGGETVLARWPS